MIPTGGARLHRTHRKGFAQPRKPSAATRARTAASWVPGIRGRRRPRTPDHQGTVDVSGGHASAQPRRAAVFGVPVRLLGPLAIGLLAAGYGALWVLARPPGEPLPRHLGQLFGGESILLMSIALVLISTLPHVEQNSGGIDYAAIWHRRLAITGTVLLLPHVELASNPEATSLGKALAVPAALGLVYRHRLGTVVGVGAPCCPRPSTALCCAPAIHGRCCWSPASSAATNGGVGFHRLTGLFVAAGFLHGLRMRDGLRIDARAALELRGDRRRRLGVERLPGGKRWPGTSFRIMTTRCRKSAPWRPDSSTCD